MIYINAYELKEYIIENDKIKDILESIECHHIKDYSKYYSCGRPNHSGTTSISVDKKTLSITIYGRGEKIKGDIFSLIMNIKTITFSNAIKYVHTILGLKYVRMKPIKDDKNETVDILRVFKKAMSNCHRSYYDDIKILDDDITNEYIECPYIEWVREGILPNTQKIFGIGYSAKSNRVVIPHRYWCGSSNDYVGVIGRTLNKHYDLLDIPKYFPLHSYPKSMNIYGLQENYEGIQKAGYVNVFEAEKSTLKRHSRLDYTGVSLGCHEISDEQAKILIGLNVDIIIQMDKDIELEHIWSMCELFYGVRNVYYVYDNLGLLSEKESPADKHNKIYKALFNRKVKYDEHIHNKYIEYKKKLEV